MWPFCNKRKVILNNQPADITALGYCDSLIRAFANKADHNKDEALRCFLMIMAATLLTPLFITLGEGFILGKVVPACLSSLAAFFTAWIQLRKPQQLWALYRSCQRKLEDTRTKYTYRLDEFAVCEEPEKLLATKTAEIALEAHEKWLPIVPNVDTLNEGLTQVTPR